VALCGTCHTEFDFADDPGWVFHPTDIKYFIRFECEDRVRRGKERAAGQNKPKRKIPNGKQYLEEQRMQGLLTEDAIGGLYMPVFLRSFLYSDLPLDLKKSLYDHLCRPRPWHGAPIAAFKRTFAALGSLRIARFSDEAINDLRVLHDLYFRLPENFDVAGITPAPSDRRPDQRDQDPRHPGGDSSEKRAPAQTLEGRGKTGRTGTGKTGKTEKTEKTGKEGSQDIFWTLGPHCTSSICMERFGAYLTNRSGAAA
jgi:hypothetical protein